MSTELNYDEFVRSRMVHWKQAANEDGADVPIGSLEEQQTTDECSNFVVDAPGPQRVWAVFEDDGSTGWLYLYDGVAKTILRCAHVYNRRSVNVNAKDVDVVWSTDKGTAGVAVWGRFYAFLGVANGIEMRKSLVGGEADGFYAAEWPDGFSHLLLKDEEQGS
jgi:hypothetical protein